MKRTLTTIALSSLCLTAYAADWPQWRGPNRDGSGAVFVEPAKWPEQLTERWKVSVGLGHASPVLVGDRLYVFARLRENETVSALDAASGKVLWRSEYPAPYQMNPAASGHGPGPKSTPVVAGGRVFTLGISGILSAFDAGTG